MAKSNRERVGHAMDLLAEGLRTYVEREMESKYGEKWVEIARQGVPGNDRLFSKMKQTPNLDTAACLGIMWDQWNTVFGNTLGKAERSIVSELRDWRNRWAHQETFSNDDAYRALDSMERLLNAVSAGEQMEAVKALRQDLMRDGFERAWRNEKRKVTSVEGKPVSGLKPWREVVTPHPDVSSGKYQQAEFAADLWQVHMKEASSEYLDPTEFFKRTFITDGLRELLSRGVQRLAGKGGDPVVELQTNFGGGKTHSMLALYHLFGSVPAADLPGVDQVLKEAGADVAKNVRRAVLVGTRIAPGQPHTKTDGTVVRTLWGEMAWQIGGKDGFKVVKEADETGTNPGDAIRELFKKYAPCLVLIDEWVAYARQLHDDLVLPAGTFDTQFTFAQALTECAKSADRTLVVMSIPASESPHQRVDDSITNIEVGGERGREALKRLKNVVTRVAATWKPASPDEGFEIVRRRLFLSLNNEQAVQRDLVARAYVDMYGAQPQEFPSGTREAEYERRLRAAYPIHPELFERLFNDWSTLEKFQRTRGVLRLMAAVIHSLWEKNDGNLLIMPANVPIDDPHVQFELTRYLDDQWVPVIEKDVDGPHSLPLAIDRDNPNLGRYSACRRVARTLYMGSAPTTKAANRGVDDRQIRLGCVQPGESVPTFGDALRRLGDRATYLYQDGARYWYSTQPTVTRLAEDRAAQLRADAVHDEIVSRLKRATSQRGEFSRVHVCVPSGDVTDDPEVRLVVLGPEFTHTQNAADSLASKEAAAILESRGASQRNFKNCLVFLAADANRLADLENAVRQFIAWQSICDDREKLNLDAGQARNAESRRTAAEETIGVRIPEAYCWLIAPSQKTHQAKIEFTASRLQGQDSLPSRAIRRLKSDSNLITQWAGPLLRMELDRVPLWQGDHVKVSQLADYFARYVYLPRLRDERVLVAAVREGASRLTWESETFAYARAWDERSQRYIDLVVATDADVMESGLVVKSDVAKQQFANELESIAGTVESKDSTTSTPVSSSELSESGESHKPRAPIRFHATAQLPPERISSHAGKVAQEVIQHLAAIVGSEVDVTLEIRVETSGGIPEHVVRTVSENCTTLKIQFGFEDR